MSELPRVRRPCDECPWRRDAEPGRFPAERYEALRATAGRAGAEAGLHAPMFACHKTPDGADRVCAGWLATVGAEHIGVRLACLTGRLSYEALRPAADWPALFADYSEMAESQDPQ